ncbi:hypothetical protein BESB_081410 [Besnoitia besnoiti]|uniref:HXXEE motif protein n=1 Tax=Besnoitia besnoiti TaxID=94643 RepID=A0A2A9MC28_BESBE|nr:hypothetical protein BESB_081410 [Besnoitia besnoiti]PFH32942.1 hypothetical protein BESB_081410 [Besnoitia besnoiti]
MLPSSAPPPPSGAGAREEGREAERRGSPLKAAPPASSSSASTLSFESSSSFLPQGASSSSSAAGVPSSLVGRAYRAAFLPAAVKDEEAGRDEACAEGAGEALSPFAYNPLESEPEAEAGPVGGPPCPLGTARVTGLFSLPTPAWLTSRSPGSSLAMKRLIWTLLWLLSLFLTLSSPGPPFGKFHILWQDALEVVYRWPGFVYACGYLLLFYIFAGFGSVVTPRSWLAVGSALFCFHLFEEHGLNGLDVRRSPFKQHFNETAAALGAQSELLSDLSVTAVSLLHLVGIGMLAVWQGPWYGTGVFAFGLTLVDGLLHVCMFLFSGFSYNPGLFSACLLSIPSALYYFFLLDRYMLENSAASFLRALKLGLALGAAAYALLALAVLCHLPAVAYVAAYLPPLVVALLQFHDFKKLGGSPLWAELW